MSQALRKITGSCARSSTTVVFINQLRMKIGVMFGSPETTTGGNALKFYASVRLDVRRIGALKDGEHVVGNRTRVKVVKNKLAAPFKETEFDISYGRGISLAGELIDLGVEAGLIEKSGSWMSIGGERIGQGRDVARQFLIDHADVAQRIRAQLLEKACIAVGSSEARASNGTSVQVQDRKAAPAKVERTLNRSASAAAA
jgi:recombination protein RecA